MWIVYKKPFPDPMAGLRRLFAAAKLEAASLFFFKIPFGFFNKLAFSGKIARGVKNPVPLEENRGVPLLDEGEGFEVGGVCWVSSGMMREGRLWPMANKESEVIKNI